MSPISLAERARGRVHDVPTHLLDGWLVCEALRAACPEAVIGLSRDGVRLTATLYVRAAIVALPWETRGWVAIGGAKARECDVRMGGDWREGLAEEVAAWLTMGVLT